MARVEDMKIRLRLIDDVTPALRRMRFGFWLAAHTNAVLGVGFVLTGLLGMATGAVLVLWALR